MNPRDAISEADLCEETEDAASDYLDGTCYECGAGPDENCAPDCPSWNPEADDDDC